MADPHKWEFRPPPSGGEELAVCAEGEAMCRLGDLCPAAHSQRELQEWKKRKEVEVKEQLEKGTYSDRILKEVLSEKSTLPLTTTKMTGVKLVSDQDDNIKFSSRNASTVWNLFLSTTQFLKGISLLHVENLQHFSLSEVSRVRNGNITELSYNKRECAIDEEEESEDKVVNYHYRLKLKFNTKVFGVFTQTILFDFGTKPLLAKTVNVSVAPETAEDEFSSAKESLQVTSEVWNEATRNLVKFQPAEPKVQLDEDELVAKYPFPNTTNFKITEACLAAGLTEENYRPRLHQLLYMEEIAQYQEITGFNTILSLHVTDRYLLSASPSNVSTAKYARPGELFGRIELNAELSDDSKAGKLILTKCNSILVRIDQEANPSAAQEKKKGKRKNQEKKKKNQQQPALKIWECLMEDTAKSVIYVRLPAALVKDQSLVSDQRLKAEVQFKLSRLSLVEMHYAIDKLPELGVVYPVICSPPAIPWSPSHQWKENLDPSLNLKQKEAVLAITSPLHNPLPPILIIGPYGTGKTFTLGKALEILLKENANRILICTHSNSAADLYIKDYVDPAIKKGNIKKKVLRIYYYNRWVQTVHPTVQKYCLVETDEITQTRRFKLPQLKDLLEPDLVVATLSTSRCLAQQLQVGHFTHILLDEAAQALETEAIMPLILANKNTRVVLAGDHMQLEPEVVSPFALEKRLNLSILERLFDHYPSNHPCKILLCENYRSHEEIVSFTSSLFYEQKLISSGKQPPHPTWFPLTFFTARGQEIQDVNSTSYYNNYEVGEIVDRLVELRKNWPKTWGKKEDTEIGVVSPYHDQVMRIRAELRKKRLHNISVERVQNVQGKQYRAIFISTVRTRESCVLQNNKDFGFLSSAKLLNTAVTRAESLVAVVGDPVVLCSIGRCRKLWERFLETCWQNNSLFGYTWQELQSNLQAIELNNIYGLNPMAKEFIPRALAYSGERPRPAAAGLPAPNHIPPKRIISPIPPISPVAAMGLNRPPWLPMPGMGPMNARMGPLKGLPLVAASPMGFPLLNRPPMFPLGRPVLPTSLQQGLPTSLNQALPTSLHQGLPTSLHQGLPTSLHQGFMPPPPFLPAAVLSQLRPPLMPPGMGPPSPQPVAASQAISVHQNVTQVEMKPSFSKPATVDSVDGRNGRSAIDRILPPGTDLQTILQSRSAQMSWHNFLSSMGKDTEASAFEELVISEGGAGLSPEHAPNLQPVGAVKQEEEAAPTEDEEKDGMMSMFDSLMADFDKHDTNTPLYLRRGQPESPDPPGQQQTEHFPGLNLKADQDLGHQNLGPLHQLLAEQQHSQPQSIGGVDYPGGSLEDYTVNALHRLHLHQQHQMMLNHYTQPGLNPSNFGGDGLGFSNGSSGLINGSEQPGASNGDDGSDLFSDQLLTRGLKEMLGLQDSGPDPFNYYGGPPDQLTEQPGSPRWGEDIKPSRESQPTYETGGHPTFEGGNPTHDTTGQPTQEAGLPTYARVVMTSPRGQEEEDTLTKIRNLGTFGFQNLG